MPDLIIRAWIADGWRSSKFQVPGSGLWTRRAEGVAQTALLSPTASRLAVDYSDAFEQAGAPPAASLRHSRQGCLRYTFGPADPEPGTWNLEPGTASSTL